MAIDVQQRNQAEASLIRKTLADEAFKKQLLADPRTAYAAELEEAGGALAEGTEVRVVEESTGNLVLVIPHIDIEAEAPKLHDRSTRGDLEATILIEAANDSSAKQSLLADPKAFYEAKLSGVREGASLPDSMTISVVEESDNIVYFRIPHTPSASTDDQISDEQLEDVAGGAAAVGVAIASVVVVGAVAVAAILVDY